MPTPKEKMVSPSRNKTRKGSLDQPWQSPTVEHEKDKWSETNNTESYLNKINDSKEEDEFEDLDKFWASEQASATTTTTPIHNLAVSMKKKKKKKEEETKKKNKIHNSPGITSKWQEYVENLNKVSTPVFPSSNNDTPGSSSSNQSVNSDSRRRKEGATWMEQQLQRIQTNDQKYDKQTHISPSNLSLVSTAPTTPATALLHRTLAPDPPDKDQFVQQQDPPDEDEEQQQETSMMTPIAQKQKPTSTQGQVVLDSIDEYTPTTTGNDNVHANNNNNDDDSSAMIESPDDDDDEDDLFPSQSSTTLMPSPTFMNSFSNKKNKQYIRRDTLDLASKILPLPPRISPSLHTNNLNINNISEQNENKDSNKKAVLQSPSSKSPPSLERSMEDLLQTISTSHIKIQGENQITVATQKSNNPNQNKSPDISMADSFHSAASSSQSSTKESQNDKTSTQQRNDGLNKLDKNEVEEEPMSSFQNNDDDDHDDGPGFQLASSPDKDESENSSPASKITIVPPTIINTPNQETPSQQQDELLTPENEKEVSPPPRSKQVKKKKKKRVRIPVATPDSPNNKHLSPSARPAGNRNYTTIPNDNFTQDDQENHSGTRRSNRARFPPLQFWKNERVLYEPHNEEGFLGKVMGDMPVVSGIMQALPTPYKPKRPKRRVIMNSSDDEQNNSRSKKSKKNAKQKYQDKQKEDQPFDSRKLRRRFDINDGEVAYIWDETEGEIVEDKIFCYSESMIGSDLPLSAKRSRRDGDKVGVAAQSFNVAASADNILPGWIAGNLKLPPKAIKDAEGVGLCAQVFNVGQCQPKALEVAIADPEENGGKFSDKTAQRFLLSPGDMFHIPPGNIYRLENHSQVQDCLLFWTIVRPCKPT